MQIVLLGATGGTGLDVLNLALERGHDVVAIARTPEKIAVTHPHLRVVRGDVTVADTLVEPFKGSDAILSCVGVSNPMQARKGTTVYSVGTHNIIDAMRRCKCQRIVAVSSAGVAPRKGAPWIYKNFVKPFFLEPAYKDMRLMEADLSASDLDWTVVRPPQLVDGALQPNYRVQADRNFDDDHPVTRPTIAHFLVGELETPHFVRHVVAISG